MKLNFLFPGKTKVPFYDEGITSYLKRLQPMVTAGVLILKGATAAPGGGGDAEAQARNKETASILERCRTSDYLVVLDLGGKALSSPELAAELESLRLVGTKVVNLVVGGPWGVAESLRVRADLLLSMGPMTFPHELARVMLLEQIYRAYTIINRIPYHK